MTDENKKLLIKDLAARIPYGVKCEINDFCGVYEGYSVDKDGYVEILRANTDYVFIDKIKPYLFPLTSMTKEQEMELDKLNPEFYSLICEDGSRYVSMDGNTFDWFNANHFDWRGLIPKGLANDATDKNIY